MIIYGFSLTRNGSDRERTSRDVWHEAFELAAKFCNGIAVNLTASNIFDLQCEAKHLENTEDMEEGNLIFKTEAFLSYVLLSS